MAAGIDSPVTMDFVHGALALEHFAIDRHAVAGPNPETVADLNQLKGDFLVLAIGFKRRAVFGANFSKARIAPPVCSRARNSST